MDDKIEAAQFWAIIIPEWDKVERLALELTANSLLDPES